MWSMSIERQAKSFSLFAVIFHLKSCSLPFPADKQAYGPCRYHYSLLMCGRFFKSRLLTGSKYLFPLTLFYHGQLEFMLFPMSVKKYQEALILCVRSLSILSVKADA